MNTFEYITKTATKPASSWTNKQIAQFHYFNKNGAHQQWKGMTDTISQYVDDGIITTGWHLAYGSLSQADNDLIKLVTKKRVNGIALRVCVDMMREATNHGYNRLAGEVA